MKTKFVHISARLTAEEAEKLLVIAKEQNVTLTSLVRAAIYLTTANLTDPAPLLALANPHTTGRPLGRKNKRGHIDRTPDRLTRGVD